MLVTQTNMIYLLICQVRGNKEPSTSLIAKAVTGNSCFNEVVWAVPKAPLTLMSNRQEIG